MSYLYIGNPPPSSQNYGGGAPNQYPTMGGGGGGGYPSIPPGMGGYGGGYPTMPQQPPPREKDRGRVVHMPPRFMLLHHATKLYRAASTRAASAKG